MTLTINGTVRSFEASEITVDQLLHELDLAGKPVVVELNREAVLPGDYPSTPVSDGSELEIVTIAAGG
ncbi:sulfur carrier protein ThiS [Haloferula chungangensis]|uniref:Sulfur carrier protein ThiS n=1 Tax=Haloferula chungangensis TaxID=1048331 RepID=A0ABW2L717_9BACT